MDLLPSLVVECHCSACMQHFVHLVPLYLFQAKFLEELNQSTGNQLVNLKTLASHWLSRFWLLAVPTAHRLPGSLTKKPLSGSDSSDLLCCRTPERL